MKAVEPTCIRDQDGPFRLEQPGYSPQQVRTSPASRVGVALPPCQGNREDGGAARIRWPNAAPGAMPKLRLSVPISDRWLVLSAQPRSCRVVTRAFCDRCTGNGGPAPALSVTVSG